MVLAGLTGFLAWHESPWVRAQTLCAVTVACTVEYIGTHVMQWWDYRLGNLPAWVPAGHAALFLLSIISARTPAPRWLRHTAYTSLAAWSLWGLLQAQRPDYSGAFNLLAIATLHRNPVMRTRLPWIIAVTAPAEFAGTHFGLYSYRHHDITGLLLMGNPPAGLPGGYALVDFAALLTATLLYRVRRRYRSARNHHGRATEPPAHSLRTLPPAKQADRHQGPAQPVPGSGPCPPLARRNRRQQG
jgi:hypothetical protein